MSALAAFLTGLSTGGLTCLAVQGGLLVGLLAIRRADPENSPRWQILLLPVAAFLLAKLVIHTILGFGLGWLGDSIQLTTTVRIWLQTFAGAFMLLAGIRLIFPRWLPWLTIAPPASIRRLVRRSAKSELLVAPAVLGLLTVLIPCGTTQAMEVAAIATGNAWQGALLMFAFVLGTAPLFFLVGILAKQSTHLQRRLTAVAATVVIGLSLYTLNGVLVMVDSPFAWQNRLAAWRSIMASENVSPDIQANATPTIAVLPTGYVPNEVTVPAGQAVRLTLKTDKNNGCTRLFRIPKLNVERNLPETGTVTLATSFSKPGDYSFTCGMGMFWGIIHAV